MSKNRGKISQDTVEAVYRKERSKVALNAGSLQSREWMRRGETGDRPLEELLIEVRGDSNLEKIWVKGAEEK